MTEHADYPHHPGTLYDCAACEAECYCDEGYDCINCIITGEYDEC